jgi:hypothetical protein
LVLVAGCVTVASATSSGNNRSPDPDRRKVVVLDLLAREVHRAEIDETPIGFSQGDHLVVAADLFHGGTKVGEGNDICTIARIEPNDASTVHCTGVQSLPGGQVTTEAAINYGPNEFPKVDPYFIAIKGGTGKYRTAHGEGRIQELTPTEWRLTLRIIL